MTPFRLALAAGLACAVIPLPVHAQEPPAGPPPAVLEPGRPAPAPKPIYQNVRVDVTITIKGDPKPLTKSLSMVAADRRLSKGRTGIEVPVPNRPSVQPGSNAINTEISYNYRGVGVNVDATPEILDATRVLLRLNFSFSTVYKAETTQSPLPSFGNGSHEVQGTVFESGKPLIVTQATDGETGREYTVQVTATILK